MLLCVCATPCECVCAIPCEKRVKNVLFSYYFHTFFTHFSHAFRTHISHACEILHSEIYVKRVWGDVIPFTHIFTYTSDGVSHRLSHANPHLNSHIFSYTSRRVSHGLSHVFNPHWMAKHLEFHMLVITYRDSGGGEGGKIVILCTSISTQIPNHKTSKKNDISKQHSKHMSSY